uniref:GRIP domain-containing protein n=1 Tax=Mola mola TaxID=94237 RepID=A0A3Q4AJJ9_MOLML
MVREKTLKEESQDLNIKIKELEELQQCLIQCQLENESLKDSNAQLSKISENFEQCKKDLTDLEHQLEAAKNDCLQKEKSLDELENHLQQSRKELSEQEKTLTAQLNSKKEDQTRLMKQLEDEKAAHEKKMQNTVTDMEAKLKSQETKLEKFKQKAKDMHEKMAQKSSEGLSSAVTDLQANHKQELEKLLNQGQNSSHSETEMKVECSSIQPTGSTMENHSPMEDMDSDSIKSLQSSLSQLKNEKEKIHKDFTRLQKDMRLLRKEHEQDLEYMKKELMEENEKQLKLELEDIQMKHNSAIKQLMREFNTQQAMKETELDSAVKEAIEKAQIVETELISNHREEISQLRKLIAQKEEDLHRMVEKYEQVIQAQLAKKTTLLSEARLKEQGFKERVSVRGRMLKWLFLLDSTDPGFDSTDVLSEATEMEYLRKVLFEYMMGRETKTMAKVITSMLKFPPDQAQKVLEKEDSKMTVSFIFTC